MIDSYKEAIGFLTILLSVASFVIYVRSVKRGDTKPHMFTWILWSLIAWTAFLVQMAAGAGPGSWATGSSAVSATIILLLSFKNRHKEIKRSDQILFVFALMIIPIWIITESLTLSAIWLTIIDSIAFYFTIYKSWHNPHQENGASAILRASRNGLSVIALSSFTVATALYPITLTILNLIMVAVIFGRRRLG